MSFPINDNLDLKLNQLLNAAIHNRSGAPSSPVPGQVYYDTGSFTPFYYNGNTSQFVSLDATKLVSVIPIGALAVNPLARANHTGTQPSSTISDLASVVQAYALSSFAAPTAPLSAGSQRVTNVANPTAPGDAANMGWVTTQLQSAQAGISAKGSVVVVATTNQALTYGSYPTIDNITMALGFRALFTAQSTASQNGVYVAGASGWTRATTDSNNEMETGSLWFVEQGTTYGKTQWTLNSPSASGSITVGTTSIGIVQFGAANVYTNGNGLSLTGSSFAVQPVAGGGILSGSGGVQLDTTVAARLYRGTITCNGSSTSYTVTHSLGNQTVGFFVFDSSGNWTLSGVVAATANTITVPLSPAPANGAVYSIICFG